MINLKELFKKGFDLHKKEEFDEALKIYNKILKVDKQNPQLLFCIGTLYLQKSNFNLAEKFLLKSYDLDQENIITINNLATTYQNLNKISKSIYYFNISLKKSPNNAETYFKLGNLNSNLNNFSVAIENYKKAIKLKPNYLLALNNLANSLAEIKEFDESIKIFNQVIKLKNNFFEAYENICKVFINLKKYKDAIIYYNKLILIDPNNLDALNNLGELLIKTKNYSEAVKVYQTLVNLDPNYNLALGKLISTKMFLCDWKNYNEILDQIYNSIKNNYLVIDPFTLLSISDDPEFHFKNSKIYLKNKNINKSINNFSVQKNEKIRIGYFSSDFYEQAVLYLMMDVFKKHDKSKFEIFGFYFNSEKFDKWTEDVKKHFLEFHDLNFKSDEEIALICRKKSIDIAVDLKGFTENNRHDIFLRRIAPIQISYLGYPGTMGMKNIDYIIADKEVITNKNQKNFSEKILYLPNCYQANMESKKISNKKLKRSDFKLNEKNFVFCSFNHNYKITPEIYSLWMEILKQTTKSELWILKYNLDAKNNLTNYAKNQGINPSRIIFAESEVSEIHLSRLKLADLLLDTFPYNSHTTASDAMRVGLPIITLKGKSFASRVASSILQQFNLKELIFENKDDYKNKAIDLCNNPKEMNRIKNKLKNELKKTTFFNSDLLTKNLENIYTNLIKKV